MAKKRLIEDSEEVREAIADLQAKVSKNDNAEAGNDDYSDEAYAEDEDYYDETSYEDDYDYADEDIAGDTFEEVIDETVTSGTIGDVYRENEKRRKEERLVREKPVKTSSKKKTKSKKDDEVVISLENVTKAYVKGIPALKNVSLTINKGEFVFIVGGSGSGKSTLIKLLLRELKPTSGSITVNGFQLEKLSNRKIPKLRRSMGVVFQDFRLLSDRSVYENVAFAQRIVQTPAREMKKNVPAILSIVGLASMYKKLPNELSGGEQQRVAIARALVNDPKLLIADEPTGNLDPKNTAEIMNLLEEINKNGTTVVVVTHDENIVNYMKKRVVTIKKGIIVSDEEKGGYTQ